MSETLAHKLLSLVRERRDSVLQYHALERAHPDRAHYYRSQRKRAFVSALQALDWARAEFSTSDISLQSVLAELDFAYRRQLHAYREAAE